MKLLAIDTSLNGCSAALLENGALLAHRFEVRERGHAEAIVPMVEACMAEGNRAYSDLDGFAVSTGPGTYTGLRIGHAAIRGFALAAAKPVIGVTSLQAVERAARRAKPAAPPDTLILLSTRRADLYVQFFRDSEPTSEPQALKPAAIAAMLPNDPLLLAGDAAAAFADDFGRSNMSIAGGRGLPDAADIAALAAQRIARDGLPPPLEFPAPLYLRAPDVTLSAGNVGLRS